MRRARLKEIARQFPENGVKLLLENSSNVRDLLNLTGTNLVDLIDFDHLTRIPTTFVERDYRQVESDVVLRAPLRHRKGARPQIAITVYILIEHQSEPDRLMPLRLLEYVVQIFKYQTREWARHHRSFAGIRLQPVIPVVFYTGTRRWDAVGGLADLIEMREHFEPLTPTLDPLFLNLPATASERLESEGGFFGWVLRLVQERKAGASEFQHLLKRVVHQLVTMPAEDRGRWLEFLSYLHALIYHVRNPSERRNLRGTIEASVRSAKHRREVTEMGKTIADVLKREGEVRALQRTLLHQLRRRFGDVPPQIADTIELTKNVKKLEAWLDRFVAAEALGDMKIGPGSP